MSRFSSTAVFAAAICVCLGLTTSGALAQTADPSEPVDTTVEPVDTTVEPVDTTVEPEWMPGDGRPEWSSTPEATTAPSSTSSSWTPGAGQPYWADPRGQPEWAGRPTQDATSLQSSRGAFASGDGNRGRGRKR
jgi:hypothetical protein